MRLDAWVNREHASQQCLFFSRRMRHTRYWRDWSSDVCSSDLTAEAFADGWLLTGDVAERDEEGDYRIVGRTKDMVISGGENVYPAEIENVLHEHPAVVEARSEERRVGKEGRSRWSPYH